MDIHSEETKHTSHEKNSTRHRISQYNTSTVNRIQVTKHRKTTKHESKEKVTDRIEPRLSSL
jgi:hypothetical protein